MWGTATFVLAVILIAIIVGTDLVRAVVDRRRREATGYGGTQDIAMWGTLAAFVCLVFLLICGGFWIATKSRRPARTDTIPRTAAPPPGS
jgi:hypothetical protein